MIEVQSRPAYVPAGAAVTTTEATLQGEYPGNALNMPAADGVSNSAAMYQPVLPPPIGVPGNPGGTLPGWPGSGSGGSTISSLLQQLVSLVGSLLGALGGSPISSPLGGTANQQYFTNATAGSQGDPHLSFSGTTGNGTQSNKTWDSMESHPNLLMSGSFAGGYTVGAQVTPSASNGTTKNQQVTITTDGGAATVSMDDGGNVGIFENGSQIAIAAGQTVSLGNGETVTENGDGSLTVNDTAQNGGTIATTLRANGGGVDISATASDVFLGGYLAQGGGGGGGPVMHPLGQPAQPLHMG